MTKAAFYLVFLTTKSILMNDPDMIRIQVLARQFIGSPINCMSDSMSGGIMDSYCWLHSTYSVNGRCGVTLTLTHIDIHIPIPIHVYIHINIHTSK